MLITKCRQLVLYVVVVAGLWMSGVVLAAAPQLVEQVDDAILELKAESEHGVVTRGSGFVVRDDGLVVTNVHVIQDAKSVRGSSSKQPTTVEFGLIAAYPERDLAFLAPRSALERDKRTWSVIELANGKPKVGGEVFAAGFPESLGLTFTKGVVSAIRKAKELPDRLREEVGAADDSNWIQTDCPLNHGNSGGPLLTESGQAVGVNTWSLKNAEGLHFALASSDVLKLMPKSQAVVSGFESLKTQRNTKGQKAVGLPYVELAADLKALDVARQVDSLSRKLACLKCHGDGQITIRERVGSERRNGLIFPIYRDRKERCKVCHGEGVRADEELYQLYARLAPRVGGARNDPKFDVVTSRLSKLWSQLASRSVSRWSSLWNKHAMKALTTDAAKPGSPVSFIGVHREQVVTRGNGSGELIVFDLAYVAQSVYIRDAIDVSAIPGQLSAVGGLYAGELELDGKRIPVIQWATITPVEEKK